MATPKPIDVAKITERYTYSDGKLYHKNGKEAGTLCRGYLRVSLDGKTYPVHRIIWSLVNQEDPSYSVIDHIDQDKLNNQITNLRKVSNQTNQYNRSTKGYRKRGDSYQALIRINGKLVSLGSFTTPEEAALKYNQAKEELCLR
jgi:hypothetical protein